MHKAEVLSAIESAICDSCEEGEHNCSFTVPAIISVDPMIWKEVECLCPTCNPEEE
ncbi:MAG TPA: hypothetical protein VFX17_02410 [Patescibacteria group bacterium]|nr:hypothetical protein [Patescibacteria group bacterium]